MSQVPIAHSQRIIRHSNHSELLNNSFSVYSEETYQVGNDLHFEADRKGPQFPPLALQALSGQAPMSPESSGKWSPSAGTPDPARWPPSAQMRLQTEPRARAFCLPAAPWVWKATVSAPPAPPRAQPGRESSPGAGAGSAARPGVRENRVRGADLRDPPVGRAALMPPTTSRAGLSGPGLGRVRAGPCPRPRPNRGSSANSFGVFPAG